MFGVKTFLKKHFPLRETNFKEAIDDLNCSVESIASSYGILTEEIKKQKHLVALSESQNSAKHRFISIGVHSYRNLGDIAITYAQKCFIHTHFPDSLFYQISISEYFNLKDQIINIIRPNDTILLFGGGNFGDVYPVAEELRRSVILNFPKNKIVIFPQTYHFSSSESGKTEEQKTAAIYNRHRDLHIFAREQTSFLLMQKNFQKIPIHLVPDMVLTESWHTNVVRSGAICCLRSDKESKLTPLEKAKIRGTLLKILQVKELDMLIPGCNPISIADHPVLVSNHMFEFNKTRLVVTDRLHGMIFAAVTKTPCIVFENYDHKIRSFYNTWLKDSFPNIRLLENMDLLEQNVREFLSAPPESTDISLLQGSYRELLNTLTP